MSRLKYHIKQTWRNLGQSWGTQIMTLFTVSLSVLIFSFFLLIYVNILAAGDRFSDELRLVVYLDQEIVPEMQPQIRKKITDFSEVENIVFVSRKEAFERFRKQLGKNSDVLDDLGPGIMPPSIEVYPLRDLEHLSHLKEFSDYLATLPGALKVQYGQNWVERFGHFTELVRMTVIMSGVLLVMATGFMVSYTIRLTVVAKDAELEILRLLGASSSYVQTPLLIEGLMQGIIGSTLGMALLYALYTWAASRLSGPGFLRLFDLTFFSPLTACAIILVSIAMCTGGSLIAIRKYMRI